MIRDRGARVDSSRVTGMGCCSGPFSQARGLLRLILAAYDTVRSSGPPPRGIPGPAGMGSPCEGFHVAVTPVHVVAVQMMCCACFPGDG
ncbi:hypothetical protein A6A29_40565 [Streptomyces sp. TSRI0281]|nr:hypothetical protein A6A29_40565 [Streptomyces sp. TSRI0281]